MPDLEGRIFKIDDNTLTLTKKVGSGDLCDCYEGTFVDNRPPVHKPGATDWEILIEDDEGTIRDVFIKVAEDTSNNDLIENEVSKLNRIFPLGAKEEGFLRYLPQSLGTFEVAGKRAHVLSRIDGHISLAQIIKEYPAGIDYRDLAWMFKRSLEGIGFAHKHKITHGALLPEHILVHPTGHGAKLVDWSYSVEINTPLRAIVGGYRTYYPSEVFDRRPCTFTLDIFMLGKICIKMLGGIPDTNEIPDTVPLPFRKLLLDMVHAERNMRPSNAWDLHEEFDQVLRDLVGKPTYRPWPPAA